MQGQSVPVRGLKVELIFSTEAGEHQGRLQEWLDRHQDATIHEVRFAAQGDQAPPGDTFEAPALGGGRGYVTMLLYTVPGQQDEQSAEQSADQQADQELARAAADLRARQERDRT
jgi:hypothetical protein